MEGEEPQFSEPTSGQIKPPVIVMAPAIAVPIWVRILAGVETGVLGAGLMCVWLFSHSWWSGAGVLAPANIWATSIHGSAVMRYAPARPYSGLAIHFAMACLVGVIFAVLSSQLRRFPFVLIFSLFASVAWYFLLVSWNRWIALYSQQPETFLAYLLFGIVLSRMPSRSVELAGVLASTD